jgi:hypothetical protein
MAIKKTTKTVAKKKPTVKKQEKEVTKPVTNVAKPTKVQKTKKKIDWTMWILIAALVLIIIYYLFRLF